MDTKYLDSYNKGDILLLTLPVIFSISLLIVDTTMANDLIKYAFFYTIVVVPSAIVLSRLLLITLNLTLLEQAVLGYPAAVMLYSITFYVGDICGARWLVYPIVLLMVTLFLIYNKQTKKLKRTREENLSLMILYLLAACVLFISFSLMTALPKNDHLGLYYQDSLWTIGNTWSIIRHGFPVIDARFDGIPFSYHMIQNIFVSFTYMITGVDPFMLHMRITPIYDLFFLVCICNVGAKIFLDWDVKRAALLSGILFFTAGAINSAAADYLGHIYINPISMFFGLHSFILILFLLINHSRTNRFYIVYTCFVIMLAFSSKASLVFTIPPSLLIYLIYRWYKGYKIGNQELLLALGVSVIMLALRYTLYNSVSGRLIVHYYSVLTKAQLEMFSHIIGIHITHLLIPWSVYVKFINRSVNALLMIHFTIYSLSFIIVWSLLRNFRETHKKIIPFFVFVITFSVVSAVVLSFFEFAGAEVYFIWYSVIACVIPCCYIISYIIYDKPSIIGHWAGIGLVMLSFILFCYYSTGFFTGPWWQCSVASKSVWDKRATISNDEWIAMKWIKTNIPFDAVFISDRRGFNHEGKGMFLGRFFGYSALSGKQFYNEGDNFLDQNNLEISDARWINVDALIHSVSPEQARKVWNKIPADYLILSKRFTTPGYGLLSVSKVVFNNQDISILKRNK